MTISITHRKRVLTNCDKVFKLRKNGSIRKVTKKITMGGKKYLKMAYLDSPAKKSRQIEEPSHHF